MLRSPAAALLVPCAMRVLRLALESICCSTWLYITSCWVKALESIGLVGSWFFNCVVKRVRKVEKFPDSCATASGAAGAMSQLSGNFSSFLTLLTTQLKNQDPT